MARFKKAQYFEIYNDDEKIEYASCSLKATHITGICGGRSQHMQLVGVNSKINSLNDCRV